MTVGDWPTAAREAAVTAALNDLGWQWEAELHVPSPREAIAPTIDAVFAALAPHVQPRTDDWEWAARYVTGVGRVYKTRKKAEEQLARWTTNAVGLVRRRRHGEWEVAP